MKTKEIHVLQITQRLSQYKTNKNRSIRLKFIAIQWLNNTKFRVKESSYVKYYNMIQNHILPELGAWKMEQLTTEAVEQFIQKKLESGRKNGYPVKSIYGIMFGRSMCIKATVHII